MSVRRAEGATAQVGVQQPHSLPAETQTPPPSTKSFEGAPLPNPVALSSIAAGAPSGLSLPPSAPVAAKPLTPRDQMSPGVLALLDRVAQRDVPEGMPSIVEAWTSAAVWG